MSNAEKLAKDTNALIKLIVYPEDTHACDYCIYQFESCLGYCDEGVKAWLEQIDEETASDGREVWKE